MRSVLIVEDHQAVREALSESFMGWGYDVAAAATMDEATAMIARGGLHMVVIDVDLGGENATELIRSLGAANPVVLMIVISGRFELREIFGHGLELGRKIKYLKKPFLLAQLQTVVAELEQGGAVQPD